MFCHFMIWSYNYRGTLERFQRLFFINYVKDQGGKPQNLIKCVERKIISLILSVFCVKLVGGVKAERLGA